MAGYFRQLVDRIREPVLGLHPLPNAFAPQTDDSGFMTDPASRLTSLEHPDRQVRPIANQARGRSPADLPTDHDDSMPDRIAAKQAAKFRDQDSAPRTEHSQPIEQKLAANAVLHIEQPSIATRGRPSSAADEVVPSPVEPTQGDSLGASSGSRKALARPLPQHNAARPPRVRNPHRQDAFVAPAEPETATEVHIHIGRIELNAAAPSKPARRESAAVRKPMSLEEYLQHRGRKSP